MVFKWCLHDTYACWRKVDRQSNSPHAYELSSFRQGHP